jgi:hypothetical protein
MWVLDLHAYYGLQKQENTFIQPDLNQHKKVMSNSCFEKWNIAKWILQSEFFQKIELGKLFSSHSHPKDFFCKQYRILV